MLERINRLASMFLDHFSMSIVLVAVMFVFFMILQLLSAESFPDSLLISSRTGYTILLIPFLIYFLKDSYRGKSIGKRIMGLQVIDRGSNAPANALQCFIRNLFIPIWPLEILVTLISPGIRLGDILADTKVIPAKKENVKNMLHDVKQTKFSVYTIWIILIGGLYCYGLSYVFMALLP